MKIVKFTGGTPFVIAAINLGFLVDAGTWTTPGIAEVPTKDADAFEELLKELEIKYQRH